MSRGRSFAAASMPLAALLALLGDGMPAARAGSDANVGVYYATWFNPSQNPAAWSDVWGTPMLGKYESSASCSQNPASRSLVMSGVAPRTSDMLAVKGALQTARASIGRTGGINIVGAPHAYLLMCALFIAPQAHVPRAPAPASPFRTRPCRQRESHRAAPCLAQVRGRGFHRYRLVRTSPAPLGRVQHHLAIVPRRPSCLLQPILHPTHSPHPTPNPTPINEFACRAIFYRSNNVDCASAYTTNPPRSTCGNHLKTIEDATIKVRSDVYWVGAKRA